MPKPSHPRRRIRHYPPSLTPRERRKELPETIVRAAIRMDAMAGEVISLPRPARHHTIIHHIAIERGLLSEMQQESTQGFITSAGRFVDRQEAREIAFACGQVIQTISRTLTSEDLW